MSLKTHKISRVAWMAADETVKVMAALGRDKARFAGGCVRDAVANVPSADIDIATSLTPPEVMARLKDAKIQCAPTGLKHGTVTAIVNGKPFEITTLRVDVANFGRHADVRFTNDWQKDAARRDFTINAMFADMLGTVYDYFGGIEDLRLGRVVFVGDPEHRIKEDHLRILRFFRFQARFGKGAPDKRALDACAAQAQLIGRLSAERIRQETLKILEADNCATVWRIMLARGIVTQFLPEAMCIDALEELVRLERRFDSDTFVLRRLAALLDVTPGGIDDIVSALRLSGVQAGQLRRMIVKPMPVSTLMDHAEVRALVYRAGNDTARNLLLLAAAKEGDENDLANLYDWATRFRAPRLPIEPADILGLGVPSGPDVGTILRSVEEWWIAEDFRHGRTACLERLKEAVKAQKKA
ncbi:MAG: CCA tRNA nucleotidyltransferase [Alphaproteobacteria bacterium]|nr:CCA tRNA nucleotidyltransferase [Alphaproteobacteria bacterium]